MQTTNERGEFGKQPRRTNQPTHPLTHQPTNQPASQPANQPTNKFKKVQAILFRNPPATGRFVQHAVRSFWISAPLPPFSRSCHTRCPAAPGFAIGTCSQKMKDPIKADFTFGGGLHFQKVLPCHVDNVLNHEHGISCIPGPRRPQKTMQQLSMFEGVQVTGTIPLRRTNRQCHEVLGLLLDTLFRLTNKEPSLYLDVQPK